MYSTPTFYGSGQPSYQFRNTQNEMRVNGEGKITVQPDKADIRIGVITENKELKSAQEENARITTQVIHSLKELGLPPENIRTVDYSIYPLYDFEDNKQVFRAYKVDHMLNVTVNDIGKVGLVVDTAVSSGANHISKIEFSILNSNRFYLDALTLAIQNASEKAETMARELRVHLMKPPIHVTEVSQIPGGPIPFQESAFVKSASTTPIEPGQLEIAAKVQALFLYTF